MLCWYDTIESHQPDLESLADSYQTILYINVAQALSDQNSSKNETRADNIMKVPATGFLFGA